MVKEEDTVRLVHTRQGLGISLPEGEPRRVSPTTPRVTSQPGPAPPRPWTRPLAGVLLSPLPYHPLPEPALSCPSGQTRPVIGFRGRSPRLLAFSVTPKMAPAAAGLAAGAGEGGGGSGDRAGRGSPV